MDSEPVNEWEMHIECPKCGCNRFTRIYTEERLSVKGVIVECATCKKITTIPNMIPGDIPWSFHVAVDFQKIYGYGKMVGKEKYRTPRQRFQSWRMKRRERKSE